MLKDQSKSKEEKLRSDTLFKDQLEAHKRDMEEKMKALGEQMKSVTSTNAHLQQLVTKLENDYQLDQVRRLVSGKGKLLLGNHRVLDSYNTKRTFLCYNIS